MNDINNIKNKLFGKSESVEEMFVHSITIVMRKFHLNYEEIKKLPYPTFIIMMDLLEKEAKQEQSKTKGMQKHKH